SIQQEVLASAIRRLNQGEDPELIMREMARSLSNKLIHSPSSGLRNVSQEQKDELLRAARILFDIPTDKKEPDNNQ
ncbi:MAG: glutamyl-tRNA reductase, partial [Gammaproteobacteria bacterium]|nr:glutamyl-tRNA reductase [Gammaproteobacteria bacterium]